jgi:hypothetical protein
MTRVLAALWPAKTRRNGRTGDLPARGIRSSRLVVVAVTLALLSMAAPSRAAACPLIVDARGDAHPVKPGTATPADAALGAAGADIVSADAWANNGRLQAAIRVAELPDPKGARPYGYGWEMSFRAEEGRLVLYMLESNGKYGVNAVFETMTGSESAGAGRPVNLHNATGSLDYATGTVTLSAPLSIFAPYTRVTAGVRWQPVARGSILRGPPSVAAPYAYVGPGGLATEADRADAPGPIVVGRPGCGRATAARR